MTKGLMVVLSGPSGAGKDTILHTLLQRDPRVKLSISATTRKPVPHNRMIPVLSKMPTSKHTVSMSAMFFRFPRKC